MWRLPRLLRPQWWEGLWWVFTVVTSINIVLLSKVVCRHKETEQICHSLNTRFISFSFHFTFIVTSPQHKCLGEWNSYERAPDSAEKQQTIYIWTDSAKKQQQQFTYGQTVQKNNNSNLHMDRQCKKATAIYIWTDSAKKQQQQFTYGQTVQKNNNSNLHMDRQCKKATAIYIWTDSAKKQQQQFTYGQTVQKSNSNLHMDRQCKKTTTAIYIWTDSAKKQQQFTYGQYIFTDCTEDNVQNTHTYTQYT